MDRVEPLLLHIMGICLECLLNAFQWRCVRHVFLGRDHRADPGHAGQIISLVWLGIALLSLTEGLKEMAGEGFLGCSTYTAAHVNLI